MTADEAPDVPLVPIEEGDEPTRYDEPEEDATPLRPREETPDPVFSEDTSDVPVTPYFGGQVAADVGVASAGRYADAASDTHAGRPDAAERDRRRREPAPMNRNLIEAVAAFVRDAEAGQLVRAGFVLSAAAVPVAVVIALLGMFLSDAAVVFATVLTGCGFFGVAGFAYAATRIGRNRKPGEVG
ncbi:MAG: hypothetical protein AAF532_16255 [Planctomycetota bacterium]